MEFIKELKEFMKLKSNSVEDETREATTSSSSAKEYPLPIPPSEIQKFSGEQNDWADFRKKYRAQIHVNCNLTNLQKFVILKSLLPDDVFDLIRNVIDYEEAWTILEEKFSRRINVEELLATLIQQPSINGSSESIIQLLETTKKCLNGLISKNVNTWNWDMFLIHILVQKLDENTKTEWDKLQSSRKTSQTMFDFFNFLTSRLHSKKKSKKNGVLDGQGKSVKQDCAYCQEKHPLWTCDKFELLGIEDRLTFVRNKIICQRCLARKHTVSDCWKPFKCRICHSNDHHFLLHRNQQRSKSCENLLT